MIEQRTVGDGLTAHLRSGSGPTTMWVHGYTMDGSVWAPLWDRLPDWNHVAVDLPGHGTSRPLRVGESLPDLGERLAAVAVDLGAQHLVALSFGTIVGLQMAVARPDAFTSVVLASPAFGGGPTDLRTAERYAAMTERHRTGGSAATITDAWMTPDSEIFAGAAAHPQLWARLREIIDRHDWAELSDGLLFDLPRFPQAAQDLRAISSEILLVVGGEDMPSTQRSAEILETRLASASRVVIDDAGHLAVLERPEAATDLIRAHVLADSLA